MARINHHFQKLSNHYLFSEIEKRIAALRAKNPNASLINLGIGDVTKPLPPSAISALISASQEMGQSSTFRGYGPSEGYLFLRQAIVDHEYKKFGISPAEVFISDGANSDIANLPEIFALDNKIALSDPTYPVYLDTNVMAGRTRLPLKTGRYGGVVYLPCTEENGFQSQIPNVHADLIYLCSPNNPTGVALNRDMLKQWVDYAKRNKAVILFDGAYEAYITSPDVPHSIYEIEGAKEVAIEIRSFSKNAGFTGLRCSYTVIPYELQIVDAGAVHKLHSLWKRRVDTKSNGVSYPIQKAAEGLYTPSGQKEVQEIVQSYLESARLLKEGLQTLGHTVYGGVDAPYVWCKIPPGMDSWKFFDLLLEKLHLIAVPGRGFGLSGEGYIRFSGFTEKGALEEGLKRLKNL